MPAILITSTPSSANFRPNCYAPPTSEHESDGLQNDKQEAFSKLTDVRCSRDELRQHILSTDNRSDVERSDPYKLFVALCRKFHGHRTRKGHGFRARKLRWLWYCSDGRNGAFKDLWTKKQNPTRKRNDELAITVRCLCGGFSPAETEAVIKAWWENNGEGFDFMAMAVYRATNFARAMKVSAPIREQHQKEADQKYWSKTSNRILWALEKVGKEGATPKQIAETIERDVQTVKQRLSRLCKSGQVEKVKRGVYARADAVAGYRLAAECDSNPIPVVVPDSQKQQEHVVVRKIAEEPCTDPAETEEPPVESPEIEQSQGAFFDSLLEYDDMIEADRKLTSRFYRLAADFSSGRSNVCPETLRGQRETFRAAWYERHSGNF